MSSYGSQHSGYLHPSQYPPPQNLNQQYPVQPPYPTTPQPTNMPSSSLSQQFYQPPHHHQQQQGGHFSSSLPAYSHMHSASFSGPSMADSRRRSSSFGQQDYPSPHARRPSFPAHATAPIAIPQQSQSNYGPDSSYGHQQSYNQPGYASYPPQQQQSPHYHRRTSSFASHHSDERHSSQDSHDGALQNYGVLDEDTLREYERRYAKDRRLEKRPTLGDSLMSVVGKMGKAFGSDRH